MMTWLTPTTTTNDQPGPPNASPTGIRHRPTINPCAISPPTACEPRLDFAWAIEPVWRTKSAATWARTSQATTRIGSAIGCHGRTGKQRVDETRELSDRTDVGPIGGDRHRRSADAQLLRRLGPAETLDEDRPGNLALPPRQVREELAENGG